jgi:hypothetical protein
LGAGGRFSGEKFFQLSRPSRDAGLNEVRV